MISAALARALRKKDGVLPFAARCGNGSFGSAHDFELGAFAAHPKRHGSVVAVAIAPESAMFAAMLPPAPVELRAFSQVTD